MNRIRNTFNRGKVILSFLMGGDPWPEATESFGMAMLDAGSDILILGIPFSDPIEDAAGQNAHLRALASGVTTAGILRMWPGGYARIPVNPSSCGPI